MPLNKLKKYPELLVLSSLDEKSRTKSLRGIFDRDIADNENFKFMGDCFGFLQVVDTQIIT